MRIIEEAKNRKTAAPDMRSLYLKQRELLETFLSHGAISRAEYDKGIRMITPAMQSA